ncbi:hypothetical protein FBU30_001706, partial [Linnemannia zychae]
MAAYIEYCLGQVPTYEDETTTPPLNWMQEIEEAASPVGLKEMPIFRAKIKGMMLAWYNRWKIEGETHDWSRLKQDFSEE